MPLPASSPTFTRRRLVSLLALTVLSLVVLTCTLSPSSIVTIGSSTSSSTPAAAASEWESLESEDESLVEEPARVPGEGDLGGGLYREWELKPFDEVDAQRTRFRDVDILGDECLESWLGQGVPCPRSSLALPTSPTAFDVLWTWGNGSDPLWKPLYNHFLSLTPTSPAPPAARHYRSTKDELRHSLRSVMTNLEPKPRRLHLVLGDWQQHDGGEGRVGQMPGWLDWSKGVDRDGKVLGLEEVEGGTEVFVHHHSEIFLKGEGGAEAQRNHTRDSVPTYNSFAIESNLHSIPNLSPVVLYMQDDFFLLKKHTTADFVSPLYGPVLRLSSPKSYEIPSFRYPATGCEHEWSSLIRSAWLLGERFAKKKRGYLIHVAKSLSHPLLLETNTIWSSEYDTASTRRYRETQIASQRTGDLNTSWLSTWLLVERARESMLWVWVVARMGGADGVWGREEREEVRWMLKMEPRNGTEVGGQERREGKVEEEKVEVRQVMRETLQVQKMEDAFEGLGEAGPEASKYYWSSLDGPLPGILGRRRQSCTLKLSTCFGTWWDDESETISADEMFKRLAFSGDGQCGDCVLTALIASSGVSGLSALLPPASTPLYTPLALLDTTTTTTTSSSSPQPMHDLQPHMPLTLSWSSTNFSLSSLIALTNPSDPTKPVDPRVFAMKLVARYQYVSADSKALFSMIQAPTDFGQLVENVEKDTHLASLATNDDILEQWDELLAPMVRAWYGAKWAVKGWWEREGL